GKLAPSSFHSSRPSTVMSRSTPGSLSDTSTLPSPRPVVPSDTPARSSTSTSRPRSARKCAAEAPQIPAPTTRTSGNAKAAGEGVRRVQYIGRRAGDPGAAGDLGNHRGAPADRGLRHQAPGEARPDDRLVHERVPQFQ